MTFLACDLGGTRLKIGVVRSDAVLARTVEAANSGQGLAPQLPVLKRAWLRLLEAVEIERRDCAGISMAFPSLVDPTTGRILASYGKFADATQLDVPAWAQRELGLPLAVENDARMALVGEWRHGAGRGSQDLVMLTLGTGLGTAAVIGGQLLRGKHYQAGVLGGHMTVRYGGRRCSCGNVGCAEAEASTAFLAEQARSRPDFATSALNDEPTLDFAAVFKLAATGDTCALALRDQSIHVWATLVVNLIHAYDPERVILGGGVMASAEVILPAIRRHVVRHAHTPQRQTLIVASELGDDAALLAGEWLLDEQSGKR